MSQYDMDKGLFLLSSSMTRDKRIQFKKPLVEMNIQTGEGFCNIQEYWNNEGLIKDEESKEAV